MCNSQGWLPSAPGRDRSHPKGPAGGGGQGCLEGCLVSKALGCGQEAAPKRSSCRIENRESSLGGRGRQLLLLDPHEGPRTRLHFPELNPEPSAPKGVCPSLGIIASLPQVGWQQTDRPDDSRGGSWGAGVRGILDVSSPACLQVQGTPRLPRTHSPSSQQPVPGQVPALIWRRGRPEERAARTAKSEKELKKKLDMGRGHREGYTNQKAK